MRSIRIWLKTQIKCVRFQNICVFFSLEFRFNLKWFKFFHRNAIVNGVSLAKQRTNRQYRTEYYVKRKKNNNNDDYISANIKHHSNEYFKNVDTALARWLVQCFLSLSDSEWRRLKIASIFIVRSYLDSSHAFSSWNIGKPGKCSLRPMRHFCLVFRPFFFLLFQSISISRATVATQLDIILHFERFGI